MTDRKINLLTDPIAPAMIKMAAGMLFGFIAMSAFNAADTYFVGQIGTSQLAAMSFTFPVVLILNSLALGLGTGLSSTVSRAIGSGNHHKVQRLTTDGLMLSVLIVIVFAIAGIATIDPLFKLLGARGETLTLIRKYMIIWYFGTPFVVIPMAGNNVIRATGDTLTPSMIMIVSVVTNIILDPLLIFGIGPFPALGIAGAAIATVFARFITFLFSLYILTFREKFISFQIEGFSEIISSWNEIAFIGVPAALIQAINPLSLSIITHLLARFGEKVVAGFGAAGRIEMLVMIIPMSLSTVMAPFAGQNWGAKQPERIGKALRFASSVSVGWGLVVFAAAQFFAEPVLRLFNADPVIVQAGSSYLKIITVSYGLLGVLFMSSQSFNALNRPFHAAGIILTKALLLNIPLAYAGAHFFMENGIFAATLTANVLTGIFGFIFFQLFLKRNSPIQVSGDRA